MRKVLHLLLVLSIAAVFPAAAQAIGSDSPCAVAATGHSEGGCCGDSAPSLACQIGCNAAGSGVIFALANQASAARAAETPAAPDAVIVFQLARAPETAPPKYAFV